MKSEWIKVKEKPPVGIWQVYLDSEYMETRIHTALVKENITVVSGHFYFDVPKITHYKDLPESPKDE